MAVVGNHHVVGLQVAVHDARGVRVPRAPRRSALRAATARAPAGPLPRAAPAVTVPAPAPSRCTDTPCSDPMSWMVTMAGMVERKRPTGPRARNASGAPGRPGHRSRQHLRSPPRARAACHAPGTLLPCRLRRARLRFRRVRGGCRARASRRTCPCGGPRAARGDDARRGGVSLGDRDGLRVGGLTHGMRAAVTNRAGARAEFRAADRPSEGLPHGVAASRTKRRGTSRGRSGLACCGWDVFTASRDRRPASL